mmetsp:Transcript_7452/g.23821  ORF Transcript_7452/g.23821 Transcript_7452/m.23821 type:complete len:372 (-) Transcript_7452:2145-3260(-)
MGSKKWSNCAKQRRPWTKRHGGREKILTPSETHSSQRCVSCDRRRHSWLIRCPRTSRRGTTRNTRRTNSCSGPWQPSTVPSRASKHARAQRKDERRPTQRQVESAANMGLLIVLFNDNAGCCSTARLRKLVVGNPANGQGCVLPDDAGLVQLGENGIVHVRGDGAHDAKAANGIVEDETSRDARRRSDRRGHGSRKVGPVRGKGHRLVLLRPVGKDKLEGVTKQNHVTLILCVHQALLHQHAHGLKGVADQRRLVQRVKEAKELNRSTDHGSVTLVRNVQRLQGSPFKVTGSTDTLLFQHKLQDCTPRHGRGRSRREQRARLGRQETQVLERRQDDAKAAVPQGAAYKGLRSVRLVNVNVRERVTVGVVFK